MWREGGREGEGGDMLEEIRNVTKLERKVRNETPEGCCSWLK